MRVRIRLFALLRDLAGVGETTLELRAGATAGEAVVEVGRRFPAVGPALSRIAIVVNMTKVDASAVLADGDELALLPPVSGG